MFPLGLLLIFGVLSCLLDSGNAGRVLYTTASLSHSSGNVGRALDTPIATWLITSYYTTKHCKPESVARSTFESYGSCLLSSEKAEDGTNIYYTDQLNPSADGRFGSIITYFFSTSDCSVRRSKTNPSVDTMELYPTCTETAGLFVSTTILSQSAPPEFPFDGGYMFSTFAKPNCEEPIFFALARAENSCIPTSNQTSVKFECQAAEMDALGGSSGQGQTMRQTRYQCMDCSCESTQSVKMVVMTQCGTKSIAGSQHDIYYSAVCDAQFPSPTMPPLPSPGISAWVLTTDYGADSQCDLASAKDTLLESYGLCLPSDRAPAGTSLYKLQVVDDWRMTTTGVPVTTYFFQDETCETAASMDPTYSSARLGECYLNADTGTYMISEMSSSPEEPPVPYTGGFIYTSYASDQCFSDEKIFSMTTALDSCIKSGLQESYKIVCSDDGVVTETFSTSDCTGESSPNTKPLTTCAEDSTSIGSWVTLECTAQFAAPTPGPGVDTLPIEIMGWLTTREYADGVCSMNPAFESSVSIGLCSQQEEMPEPVDGEDPDSVQPIIVYSTRQVTDATTDAYIIITTYFFSEADCTGAFYREPEDARFEINSCGTNSFDDAATTAHDDQSDGGGRRHTATAAAAAITTTTLTTAAGRHLAATKSRGSPTSRPTHKPTQRPVFNSPTPAPVATTSSIVAYRPGMVIPQPPYAGGYYYVTYANDQCTMDSATFVYVAPENQCIRYHNGTSFVSSSYACDADGSEGVSIDDYDSEDCTGSFVRTAAEASTCSPEEDGTFSSLQCMTTFPAPTAAPALSSDITAWIATDYFGTDKTCKGQPTDSVATSYGLCLSTGTQDEDGNDLYLLDALEPQADESSSDLPLTTYYYSDPECTVDAGDPVDSVITLWNCEKDETGAYAISYYVDGPISPEAPFPGGYLNVVFDSEDCSSERKVTYTAAYEGTCAESWDQETGKATSYQVTCEADATGANLRKYSKPFCKGTSTDDFLEATPCALMDEDHPEMGSYSIECGEFSAPTPAPAPVMRDISAWLSVVSYTGAGCSEAKKISWEAQSYGLCVSMRNVTDGSTVNFVREVVYDKKTPEAVTIVTWLYEDEECSFLIDITEADKAEMSEKTQIGVCQDFDNYSSKTLFQPGPTPPPSGYEGGYMVTQYNYETCAFSTLTSISILPAEAQCIPGEDNEAGVKSYSVTCDKERTATVTRFAAEDCSGKPIDSFLQTPEECVDDASEETTSFSSYTCAGTFAPTPTAPPVPPPSALAIQGWIQEDKYVTDSCDVVEKSEAFSVGLCNLNFDPHSDSLKYELKTATVMGSGLSIKTYFYEDADCNMFRNEVDELMLEEFGDCHDGGDGNYYRQTYHAGPAAPQDPFDGGVVQMDFAQDGCSASSLTHVIYDPANNLCVNSTSPSEDDDYSFFITGSETFSCTSDGVQIKHYNQSDCQGAYESEVVRNTDCSSKLGDNGADIHYSVKCYVMQRPGQPTSPPTVAPKMSIQYIDFIATQTIMGASIKEFQTNPAVYEKALRTAVAASCGTPSIIPADIAYMTVSAGVSGRRLQEGQGQGERLARARRLLSASSRAAIVAAQRAGLKAGRTVHAPLRHAVGKLSGSISDALRATRRLSAKEDKLHSRTLSSSASASAKKAPVSVRTLHGHWAWASFDAMAPRARDGAATSSGKDVTSSVLRSLAPGSPARTLALRRATSPTQPLRRVPRGGKSARALQGAPKPKESIVITYRVTARTVGITNANVIANLKTNVANGFFDLSLHSAAKDDGAFGLIAASSTNIIFSAPDNSYSSAGLSVGAIVGIVIGVLAAVCLAGTGAYYYLSKRYAGRDLLSGFEMVSNESRRGVGFPQSSHSLSTSETHGDYDDDGDFHDEGRHDGSSASSVVSAMHRLPRPAPANKMDEDIHRL